MLFTLFQPFLILTALHSLNHVTVHIFVWLRLAGSHIYLHSFIHFPTTVLGLLLLLRFPSDLPRHSLQWRRIQRRRLLRRQHYKNVDRYVLLTINHSWEAAGLREHTLTPVITVPP